MVDEPTMSQLQSVRIDKWLWAVRLCKTRTTATDACRGGHVKVGGETVKPAREVRLGEIITVKTGNMTKTVKVLGFVEHRVGAPAAKAFVEDLTPPEEYQKARQEAEHPLFFRPKGTGRPTKKDRRDLERFF